MRNILREKSLFIFTIFCILLFTKFQIASASHFEVKRNYEQDHVYEDDQRIVSFDAPTYILNETSNTELKSEIRDAEDGGVYSFTAKVIFSTMASITSLVTVCGNLLVMSAFFLDRQIRNPTNYFLLSLSVSDFLIGLFSMPLYTLYLMLGVWPFGEVICNLWLSLDYTVCLTSIYTVLFITIDRFCSVKMPAKYRKWRTNEKVLFMVALTWVIPISLFFTSIFAWNYSQGTEFDPRSCDVGWSKNRYFNIGLVISYFWTTLLVMIVLYIFIYEVASKLEKRRQNEQKKVSFRNLYIHKR